MFIKLEHMKDENNITRIENEEENDELRLNHQLTL